MRLPKFLAEDWLPKVNFGRILRKVVLAAKVLVSVRKPRVACQLLKVVLAAKKKVGSNHCQLPTLAIDLFFT
jgi:hypothetical protein